MMTNSRNSAISGFAWLFFPVTFKQGLTHEYVNGMASGSVHIYLKTRNFKFPPRSAFLLRKGYILLTIAPCFFAMMPSMIMIDVVTAVTYSKYHFDPMQL